MLSSVNSTLSDTFTKLENRSSADQIPLKHSKEKQVKDKTLSKEQLRTYTKDGRSDTPEGALRAETDFLNHLFGNDGNNGDSGVTFPLKKHDVETKLAHVKSQEPALRLLGNASDEADLNFNYDGEAAPVPNSFDSLAIAVGAVNSKISKDQLMAYLQALKSSDEKVAVSNDEIAFIKNVIAKFDTISCDGKYITSLDGIKEPQDPETVTAEQLEFPIDLRV